MDWELSDYLLDHLPSNLFLIGILSIAFNIIISIFGFLPSAIVTGINLHYYSFNMAIFLSIVGESLGAVISFLLYRKGLIRFFPSNKNSNKILQRLSNASSFKAAFLIIILRILPFIPSGIVTLTAAFSKIGVLMFTISSTIGKIPALLLEAYSLNTLFTFLRLEENIIYIIIALLIIIFILKTKKKNN